MQEGLLEEGLEEVKMVFTGFSINMSSCLDHLNIVPNVFFFNFSNNDIVGPEEINQEGLGVSCNVPFHFWLKTGAMCSFEFVFF